MAKISLNDFGSVLLRDGKPTCRFCPCSVISNPSDYNLPQWMFDHNTFTITEEEYYNFLRGKQLNVNVNISNSENYKIRDFFGVVFNEGSLNFSVEKSTNMVEGGKGCCYRAYSSNISFDGGSMYLYEDFRVPAGVNLNVSGNVLLYLYIALNENNGEYKANYIFQLNYEYVATAIIDGIEYYWSSESPALSEIMLSYTTSYFWDPSTSFVETNFPNNIVMNINGTTLETPKTYRGPRAYRGGYFNGIFGWTNFSNPPLGQDFEYNNSSSVEINISHDT